MRIRIIGSCGSGKSTLARELSKQYGIPYYEIDNLIWDRSAENLKHPEEVRDRNLESIVCSKEWIVEGVQYKDWTQATVQKMIVRWNHQYNIQKVKEIVTSYQKDIHVVRNKIEVINKIELGLRNDALCNHDGWQDA